MFPGAKSFFHFVMITRFAHLNYVSKNSAFTRNYNVKSHAVFETLSVSGKIVWWATFILNFFLLFYTCVGLYTNISNFCYYHETWIAILITTLSTDKVTGRKGSSKNFSYKSSIAGVLRE